MKNFLKKSKNKNRFNWATLLVAFFFSFFLCFSSGWAHGRFIPSKPLCPIQKKGDFAIHMDVFPHSKLTDLEKCGTVYCHEVPFVGDMTLVFDLYSVQNVLNHTPVRIEIYEEPLHRVTTAIPPTVYANGIATIPVKFSHPGRYKIILHVPRSASEELLNKVESITQDQLAQDIDFVFPLAVGMQKYTLGWVASWGMGLLLLTFIVSFLLYDERSFLVKWRMKKMAEDDEEAE
ncbi:hypothetical protein [Candidatus Methylacidiphilum infernorum]|uniref:Uncharacterized protein n=1 Tax=Methylacidiphilum infernorum (isolate V4) TaxID=481448 RepID=B3DW49_METI4|nr:hypothetical protein [Candidatus Methylacidiphilum infernorum]ACD83552.1 Conserved hypothetical protein [Methylacidiphilum infernorum V4]